jgi:hypothetical protein
MNLTDTRQEGFVQGFPVIALTDEFADPGDCNPKECGEGKAARND